MEWFNSIWIFIRDTILAESLGVIFGIFVVDRIRDWIQEHRFGGWQVKVIRNSEIVSSRPITSKKACQIFGDETDLGQFLKSESSIFEWLNEHPLDPKFGISTIDKNSRKITINLDNNPDRKRPN